MSGSTRALTEWREMSQINSIVRLINMLMRVLATVKRAKKA